MDPMQLLQILCLYPDKPKITNYTHQISNLNIEGIVKGRSNDRMPAFAGMTTFVFIWY